MEDVTVGGATSRSLPDRTLNHAIEQAWCANPLSVKHHAGAGEPVRQNALHIFRHRRGMLFVSPIRVRAFVHEEAGSLPFSECDTRSSFDDGGN